jgi:5'-nucleotidase
VFRLGETENDTDVAALRDRYITITPLQFDLTDHRVLKEWGRENWRI